MLTRRAFLSGLRFATPAAAGVAASGAFVSHAHAAAVRNWRGERHAQDDWLDRVPGKHRLVFDTTTADGFGQALLYVNNYLGQNGSAYGLHDSDLAVVIVARHRSTPYAFNDAMWAKYSPGLTQLTLLNDPNTKQPPAVNVYNAATYDGALLNRGVLLDGLLKRGVHLAVCSVGTYTAASFIVASTGGDVTAVMTELGQNCLANAHMVPAGIVTVNRAQEHGYAFAYAAGI